MDAATPNRAPLSAGLRSLLFRRWHFSSRVVVVLTFLLLVVVNLPGNVSRHLAEVHGNRNFALVPQYEHGWPLTHIVRNEDWVPGFRFADPTITKCWRFWDLSEQDQFHGGRLVGNIAIGLAITILTGCLFEIWRRRHRSLWQIHLFDVGLAITALAGTLGWYVAARSAYEREQAAVAAYVDEMTENGAMRSNMFEVEREQRGPTWVRLWIGDRPFEVFDRVIAAESRYEEGKNKLAAFRELRKTQVSCQDLKEVEQLGQFHELEELELRLWIRTEPAGTNTIRLPALGNLRVLTIYSVEIRVTGLAKLQNLRVLDFRDSFMTAKPFEEIGHLENLRRLSLSSCSVSTNSAEDLRALFKLEELNLDRTEVDDKAISILSELPALRRLSIQRTDVSEASLKSLAKLPSLESLTLDALTNTGLQYLTKSPRLQIIQVTAPDLADSWPDNVHGWKIDAHFGDSTWTFHR